jgi:magnesium transporter
VSAATTAASAASAASGLASLGRLELETAAEHVCRDVPVFGPDARADEMRHALSQRAYELVSHLAICEARRLLGIVRIEALLPAPAGATARELMDTDPPVVSPLLDQEKAAWHAVKHGESALAVLDEDGLLAGLVPPQRLLEVLLWEHDEDISRLGGVLHRQSLAHASQEESTLRRLAHRLPWLLVGLAGAILAAQIVEGFEAQLQRNLLLTMFLPGVVYLADAVGTQTETLVVRGLSLGLDLPRMLRKEILTGLGIGVILASVFFVIAVVIWGHAPTLGVVAIALFAASAVASVVALLLPWLLDRAGVDPAFGAGPLATVIQDLLSILIYLWVALAVLG